MDKFDKRTYEIIKRLQNARRNLFSKQPFFALLLMNLKFALDTTCEAVYTDGERVAFNPDFLDKLSDSELEFILMHETMHTALGHPFRKQENYDLMCYDMACDIVVNSNIYYSSKKDIKSITLKEFGVAMHKTPSGKEGYECTVEEVYDELIKTLGKSTKIKKKSGAFSKGGNDNSNDTLVEDNSSPNEESESDDTTMESCEEKSGGDSKSDAKKEGNQKSGFGKGKTLPSNNSQDGPECNDQNNYDLEGLINQLKAKNLEISQKLGKELIETQKSPTEEMTELIDDHSFWRGDDEYNSKRAEWQNYVMQSVDAIMEKENAHKGYGGAPLCMKRMIKELTQPEVDWRTVLNEFVQEEICDYSFSPPDKRMDDCPFFLPDFNEKEERIKNVWFLIDTSGSIGDKQIAVAYSEIVSAIDMFDGHLEGLLSFTEVFVTEPIPFCSIEELLEIKPVGGGGNDFSEIFRYMQKNMMDDLPTSIVILTDGYDCYPGESEALGIPVFWLINNQEAEAPPWGRWARFKVN